MNQRIPREIFRAYDIRGIVPEQLSEQAVFQIGQAIGSLALESGINCLLTGRDGRLSSPQLAPALRQGILASGCDVVDLGLIPTPLLYFATFETQWDSGVMLTASHNPKHFNGIKIVLRRSSLAEKAIANLAERIEQNQLRAGQGQQTSLDIRARYLDHVVDNITLHRPLKLVVDCANAVPAVVAADLFRAIGCDVHCLNAELDGQFPSHPPDPTVAANLAQLSAAVAAQGADLGLAFDGDGDRLGMVTNTGKVVSTDQLLMLLVKYIAPDYPGQPIVFDVKCSRALPALIKFLGCEPVMHCSGHSLMKQKMVETRAPLGGEYSAHVFLHDRWYGFDDGLYVGARVAEIVSKLPHSVDTECALLATPPSTAELRLEVPESEKFSLMQRIIELADFPDGQCITLDGLRVEFENGWGLIRASNTSAALLMRFEGDSCQDIELLKQRFKALLRAADTKLDTDF